MTESMSLISAQISFLEPQLVLIHIPIPLYPLFIQPIFRLLFGEDHDEDASKIPWSNRHDFLNISVTPVECSITCTRYLADRFVRPVSELLESVQNEKQRAANKNQVQIGAEDYIVVQVDGQGLDAGQRVLELTSPLAMAGISIFFVTTYFSDYILVPSKSRRTVTKALEQQGFVFSQEADAFVSPLSPSSPVLSSHQIPRPNSSGVNSVPTTPPAKDMPELQLRTFTRLKKNKITPLVDRSIRLANCAASREYSAQEDNKLRNDLMQVLLSSCQARKEHTNAPRGLGLAVTDGEESFYSAPGSEPDFSTRFLSITITSNEPVSILLEHRLLDRLGSSLLGAKSDDDALVPITLDLRELPMEATGIICGVAGRLAQGVTNGYGIHPFSEGILEVERLHIDPQGDAVGTESRETDLKDATDQIEISFLSTARAGTVIVRANQLERAIRALDAGMTEISVMLEK